MSDEKTLDVLTAIANAMEQGGNAPAYAVMIFKIGTPNLCNYITNVDIGTLKTAMLETADRLEGPSHVAPSEVQ